jgi:hypothetical protein
VFISPCCCILLVDFWKFFWSFRDGGVGGAEDCASGGGRSSQLVLLHVCVEGYGCVSKVVLPVCDQFLE